MYVCMYVLYVDKNFINNLYVCLMYVLCMCYACCVCLLCIIYVSMELRMYVCMYILTFLKNKKYDK